VVFYLSGFDTKRFYDAGDGVDMIKEREKPGSRRKIKPSSSYGWDQWRCEQRDGKCVVSGYVEVTELWQPIAVISGSANTFAEIARLVELRNGEQTDADLLRLAFDVLKSIEDEGFTFATELDLDDVIERLEKQ
jgi:hypothetical protein